MNRTLAARSSRRSIPVYRRGLSADSLRNPVWAARRRGGPPACHPRALWQPNWASRAARLSRRFRCSPVRATLRAPVRAEPLSMLRCPVSGSRGPRQSWWKLVSITELFARRQHRSSFRSACRPGCVPAQAMDANRRAGSASADTSRWSIPICTVAWVMSPRLAIASYLRIARDITCSADQIMITAGFQGALGLIIQALLKPGVKVWVEDPGYVSARNLLQQAPTSTGGRQNRRWGVRRRAALRSAPDAALALVTPSHLIRWA